MFRLFDRGISILKTAGLAVFALPVFLWPQGADILLTDFEGTAYPAGWAATGMAFGSGPAQGALPNQQAVSGYQGNRLANSFLGGDASTGTLQSPNFTIQRRCLNFLLGGGNHPQVFLELSVDGLPVATLSGNESEGLFWHTLDLSTFAGKTGRIRIVDNETGGWGHILVDQIVQSDAPKAYQEAYRPQFHFSAPQNWLNDPNGLVYYKGEYHLFYQHNPYGIDWGNMTWGHAISPDMVHWQNLPVAITPDGSCTAYSGTVVVDGNNTAGFQSDSEKTLVAAWTSFGCGQRIAYSNDKGRTWTKYSGNPVIPHSPETRDPFVFRHTPSGKWILAIWTPANGNGMAFYSSTNLKTWTYLSIITGFFECPNIFQLPLDGNAANQRWVLYGADGRYAIGNFDGTRFTQQAGLYTLDWGNHWYASQVYSDIPAADGRILNISWMRNAQYPGMPFNQQMSIPTSMKLKTLAQGVRLLKFPVKEIEDIRIHSDTLKNTALIPGQNPLSAYSGDLFDISGQFRVGGGATNFGIRVRGTAVTYNVGSQTLTCLGTSAPLAPVNNVIRIRILLDRASVEVFGNDGEVSLTNGFLPPGNDLSLAAFAVGGNVTADTLQIHKLRGAWDPKDLAAAWLKSQQPTPLWKGPVFRPQSRFTGFAPGKEAVDALGRTFREAHRGVRTRLQ